MVRNSTNLLLNFKLFKENEMDVLGINGIRCAWNGMKGKSLTYKMFVFGMAIGMWLWFYWEVFCFLKERNLLP